VYWACPDVSVHLPDNGIMEVFVPALAEGHIFEKLKFGHGFGELRE
jgi:hypothetical protein